MKKIINLIGIILVIVFFILYYNFAVSGKATEATILGIIDVGIIVFLIWINSFGLFWKKEEGFLHF